MTTVSVSTGPEQSSTHLHINISVYDNVRSTIRVSRHDLIKQYACCHSIKHRNLEIARELDRAPEHQGVKEKKKEKRIAKISYTPPKPHSTVKRKLVRDILQLTAEA